MNNGLNKRQDNIELAFEPFKEENMLSRMEEFEMDVGCNLLKSIAPSPIRALEKCIFSQLVE